MKIVTLIGVAAALAAPSLASAQRGDRGGGAVAVQRVDAGRAITPARDVIVLRGDVVRGAMTGTRIVRRPAIDPTRRRPHHPARRRYYNATH